MAQRIKTNIKFYKGLENVADRLYGFVTKTNGSWKGCRETESKKKNRVRRSVYRKRHHPQYAL